MTDRSLRREPAWRAPLAFLLVFALCLFLYSTLITTGKFIDEMDVFLGGDIVFADWRRIIRTVVTASSTPKASASSS